MRNGKNSLGWYFKGAYPRCDAGLILIDYGDAAIQDRFVERLIESEPHDEVWDQEVEMVWRMRKVMPDLAAKWFMPQPHDDVPFAEVRARLGDPIAVHHVLGDIAGEEDEAVPSILAHIRPELIACFVDASRISGWRRAALQWAEDTWKWNWGNEGEVLAVAANMEWPDVSDRLAANPFLLPGLLTTSEGDPGVLFSRPLLLAWSKLDPSPFLMRLVGFVFRMDLSRLSESLARRVIGSADDFTEYPKILEEHPEYAERYTKVLGEISEGDQRCLERVVE